ncbi:MAG: hypothetical protein JNK82_07155 [Myxococcaceae bacterium]|nr:hypothetical protein [Myxococcaceae bacterium]
MLRHIRRLEGLPDEPDEVGGSSEPDAAGRRRRTLEERGPALADPSLDAWCSFCCRPKAEAGALVGGPTGSFICASCAGTSLGFLGGTRAPSAKALELLPAQQAAAERLSRGTLGVLFGPAGSGKSTVLAALKGATCLEPTEPLSAVPDAPRVVISICAVPPPAPLMLKGQPVWDTATLVTACGELVPEAVLARVDAVAVLPTFDAESLRALAARLGVTEDAEALVQLALKSKAPARELCALVARL